MLDFYNLKEPKARKEYKCDLCNQLIQVGETYCRYSGKYDGELFDDKYHLVCKHIINAYCRETDDNEYDVDSIQDWLHDKHCYDCSKCEECEQIEFNCPLIRKFY